MLASSNAMDRLAVQLRRLRATKQQAGLADALFGSRRLRYASRRLLFPLIRALSTSFFHALEAAAVALIFDPAFLVPLIHVRLVSAIAGAALWGATEPLRRDVRHDAASHKWDEARARIARARSWARVAAALTVLAGLGWVILRPHIPGYFSVVDAYVLAVALRVAVNVLIRTYHSGIFALGRIYRPRWTFVGPDLVDGLGLFALWPLVGPWAVALTVVVASLLRAAVTVPFVRRAYARSPLGCVPPLALRDAAGAAPRGLLLVIWSAIGGLATEAHSWVVLWLWISRSGEIALVAYALRPLVSLLLQLPRLFYADLQLVERSGSLAIALLRRYLRQLALGATGLFAITIIILTALATQSLAASAQAALFGLFVAVAAIMTHESIEALMQSRVSPLLTSAALIALPLLSAPRHQAATSQLLLLETLAVACAFGLLMRSNRRHHRPSTRQPMGVPLDLAHWLARLRRERPSGRLLRVDIGKELDGRATRSLARILAQEPGLLVTSSGQRELLVFESEQQRSRRFVEYDSGSPAPHSARSAMCSSALQRWTELVRGMAGVHGLNDDMQPTPAAIAAAITAGRLPNDLTQALTGPEPQLPTPHAGEVRPRTREATRCAGRVGSWGELLRAIGQAGRARQRAPELWGDWYPSAVVDGTELVSLQLLPAQMPATERRRHRRAAWRLSMRLSAGDLIPTRAQPSPDSGSPFRAGA
jgi:hypothetical protein